MPSASANSSWVMFRRRRRFFGAINASTVISGAVSGSWSGCDPGSARNGRDDLARALAAGKRAQSPGVGNIKLIKLQTEVFLRYAVEPAENGLLEMRDMKK